MLESKIQKKIIDMLKKRGAYVIKTMRTNRNGTADILACINGYFVAIESKRPGKKLEPLQENHRKQVRASNGISIKGTSAEHVEKELIWELSQKVDATNW